MTRPTQRREVPGLGTMLLELELMFYRKEDDDRYCLSVHQDFEREDEEIEVGEVASKISGFEGDELQEVWEEAEGFILSLVLDAEKNEALIVADQARTMAEAAMARVEELERRLTETSEGKDS